MKCPECNGEMFNTEVLVGTFLPRFLGLLLCRYIKVAKCPFCDFVERI